MRREFCGQLIGDVVELGVCQGPVEEQSADAASEPQPVIEVVFLKSRFRPWFESAYTEFSQGWDWLLRSDAYQAIRKSSPVRGFHVAGSILIALFRGLAIA
jgi:hypothetical protein